MNCTITGAPIAHDFNPRVWLENFTDVGGGYYVTPDGEAHICWLNPDQSEHEQLKAKIMARRLDANQTAALKAHILALNDPDPIEAAWQRIKDARAAYNAAPLADEAAEKRHWSIVDPAEAEIQRANASTLRHIEIKLWVGLAHAVNFIDEDRWVHAEDFDALNQREGSLDFAPRVLLGAIKSLRAMGA